MQILNVKSDIYSFEGLLNVISKDGKRKIICRMSPPEEHLFYSKTVPFEDCSIELELWLDKYGNHILFFDKEMKIVNDAFFIGESAKDDLIRNLIHVIIEEKIEISLPEFLTLTIDKYCKAYETKVLMAKPIPSVNKVRKILTTS